MPLKAYIVRQPLLAEEDRAQMLELHCCYFENVHRDVFLRDMAEKDWVIVLRDPCGNIAGFSTVRFVPLCVEGENALFLFSGDTVVARQHRRCGALAGAFGHVMLRALDEDARSSCYWFLISKGHRTYRFLPLYFRRFFPNCETPTPLRYDRLVRAIGEHLFGEAYDAGSGIVRHAGLGDRLAPGTCDVPEGRASDPHVRLFMARNPHYAQGDELACITDVARDNFTPAALRVIERTPVEWIEKGALCTAR